MQKRLANLDNPGTVSCTRPRKAVWAKAHEDMAARKAPRAASSTPTIDAGPSVKRKRTDRDEVAGVRHHGPASNEDERGHGK